MSHTPGPWRINSGGNHLRVYCGEFPSTKAIALVQPMERLENGGGNMFANALLVAAAPDLLEALKEVVAISDRKHDAWDKAHAAIAKAEGK